MQQNGVRDEIAVDRCEHKYIIDKTKALALWCKLELLMSPDEFSCKSDYMVRSLYFDTINSIDFYAKINGLDYGKKVRLRVYSPDDNVCKLELKSKDGVFRQKRSIILTKDEAQAIINGDLSCLLKKQTQSSLLLYQIMSLGGYRPVVLIEYRRRALMLQINDTRITFDTEVRSAEYCTELFQSDPPYLHCMQDNVILEIKFNGRLPMFIGKILSAQNITQQSISKYTTGRPTFINYLYGV